MMWAMRRLSTSLEIVGGFRNSEIGSKTIRLGTSSRTMTQSGLNYDGSFPSLSIVPMYLYSYIRSFSFQYIYLYCLWVEIQS